MKRICASLVAALIVATPATAKDTDYKGWVLSEVGDTCSLFTKDKPDPFLGLVKAKTGANEWAISIVALDFSYASQVGIEGDAELSVGGVSQGSIYFTIDDGDNGDIPGSVMTRIGDPEPTKALRGKPTQITGTFNGQTIFSHNFDPPADALAAWRKCGN